MSEAIVRTSVLPKQHTSTTRPYVSGTEIYPHMPTYVHTPRAWTRAH